MPHAACEEIHLKKFFASTMALALLAGGLYFWLAAGNNGPRYRTVPVVRGDLVQRVLATGTVNPVTLVQVGSQVSGTISDIYVDFNSKVKRGQVVAQIDPALFEAQVAKARADYQSALADVEKSQAEVENTSRTLARMRAVRERDLVSQADVDDAQMKADTAKAELEAAKARVGQTKASLDLAETNLRYTTIRSPVDGIVVDRTVDVGQTVAASFQAPVMFKIAADLSKMQVDTNVDEADIGRVVKGQEAAFSVDAYPGEEFSGRVEQVRNAPEQVLNVVTYDVVIMVDNRDLKLKPGMTANVAIITARKTGVLKVANSALRFTPRPAEPGAAPQAPAPLPTEERGWQRVWVIDPKGGLKAIPVQVGISDGIDSEVLAGKLAEGQQVVVEQIEEGGQAAVSRRPPRPF